MAAGHVSRGPRFIDEHEPFRLQIDVAFALFLALFQDV